MRDCCNCCKGRPCGERLVLCECSRYLEVPMKVVHGAGVSRSDILEDISDTLRDIRRELKVIGCEINRCCCRRRIF